MSSDSSGQDLEAFVKFVESIDLPDGFSVSTNRKILSDCGDIEAEFDILIEGNLGTSKFVWLIECRDRPSSGPAPASWIEQLDGRRSRFNFSKVTAASTTGFSSPARKLGKETGIDLRSVKTLSEAEFSDWLSVTTYKQINQLAELDSANIHVDDGVDGLLELAIAERLRNLIVGEKFLVSTKDGQACEPKDAFLALVQQNNLFARIVEDNVKLPVTLNAVYTNDEDCFSIQTKLGPYRVPGIEFSGFIFRQTIEVPLVSVRSYSDSSDGTEFSQTASFEAQNIAGHRYALNVHRRRLTGETKLVLAPQPPSSAQER